MVSNEGAGRVRLPNGARMQLRSYRESMAEQYPEPKFETNPPETPEFDELVNDVRKLRNDVDRLRGHVEPAAALQRAQADMASGKLYSDAPVDIKTHAAEAELWK